MKEIKKLKSRNCIIRLSEQDDIIIECKSRLGGISKSKLMRDASLVYWPTNFDADAILSLYKQSEDKQTLVKAIAEYYHRSGYPHNRLNNQTLSKEMIKLSNTKDPLLSDNNLQVNSTGLTIANYFHPHMMKVKCANSKRTPYEQFSDIVLLEDAINRWMELGKKPNPSGVRRILRTRDGVRSVVNFKPAIAKYFYDNYCPVGGLVLDPCAGFGGRLSGCIASNRGICYHGIDPQSNTAIGNMKLASFYADHWRSIGGRRWKFGFRFDLGCAEDIMPSLPDNSYDLIFTSPPYFNTEQYDTSLSQSYLKFPTYDLWREGFLFRVLSESFRMVRDSGYILINVKNYKRYPIASDVLEFAKKLGLVLHKTYHMRLSNLEYNRQGEVKYHTEPIFVFCKR